MIEQRASLHVPARDIPIPTSVSPEAQAVMAAPMSPPPEYPPLDDLDAWRKSIQAFDESLASMMAERVTNAPATIEDMDIGGVRVYEITPHGLAGDDRRLYVDIHGGGFIHGAGEACKAMGTGSALRFGVRTWAVDYRMPPDHPFPAALDDCLAVFREALTTRRPDQVVVGGASAGGNLAAAVVLRARDEGLALPAAVVLSTPAVDLTEAGDSHRTNLGLDPLLTGSGMPAFRLYAGDHELTDPYVSPLYGDYTSGFPPAILTTGTRDLLLSDTVRMHRVLRAAGIEAELHVTEAGGHGGFMGMAPEDAAIMEETRRFVDARWGAPAD
ncbi:MAG TPA: alpha/beta hydrolase [Acidimicrobiia bacterium]|jgi:acetyl esterase/lipase